MASNISVPTYVIQHSGGKSSWQDGEIITANSLNKMQQQIKKNTDGFSNIVQYSNTQPTDEYNQVWINGNSQQNNRTIRLAQMDDVNTILENVNNFENNVIKISDSAPEDPGNKLWIRSNNETQTQIPTYEQFLTIKTAIDQQRINLQNFVNDKIDKIFVSELPVTQLDANRSIAYYTGEIVNLNDRYLSDFIDISEWYAIQYMQIKSPQAFNDGIAFYTNNKNFLNGVPCSINSELGYIGYNTVVIPNNAKYIRFTMLDSNTYGGFEAYGMTQDYYVFKNKQDKLTFDQSPTINSTNPVTSNGIKNAVDHLENLINTNSTNINNNSLNISNNTRDIRNLTMTIALKQDQLFFDSKPIEYSDNLITSGNIYTALHEDDTITVDGTAPSIMGQAGKRYICGTVEQIRIYLPPSGTVSVRFKSGETPTVLNLMGSIKWPDGFDPTSLEANTTYRLNFEDQQWATVDKWH